MKILLDYLPLILFFGAFKLFDIFTATAVAIGASLIVVVGLKLARQKIETMMWVNVAIVVVAGSATLLFHDEKFIKWKPTILFWAIGIGLAVAHFWFKKNPLAAVLKGIEVPRPVWDKAALAWVLLYLILGGLNLLVAFGLGLSTATWVNVKVFGFTAIVFIFILAQVIWIQKFIPETPEAATTPETTGAPALDQASSANLQPALPTDNAISTKI